MVHIGISVYDKYKWLFIVLKDFYVGNKRSDNPNVLPLLIRMLESDIEFLRLNKLLVGLAELCRSFSYRSAVLDQRLRRYRVYIEEARRVSRAIASYGIKFVFFKTVTVFPKDIADLDVLVFGKEDLENAEKILTEIGYRKRKKALEQHLWSLSKNDVIVDIELHTIVAAASYEYYPKSIIFRNVVELDGVKTTSPLDSIMLTVAHSVVKDFYITLADILDFALTIDKYDIDFNTLIRHARNLGLTTPLLLYMFLLSEFDEEMHKRLGVANRSFWQKLFTAINCKRVPLRPGINTLIPSYLMMTLSKLRYKPLSSVLSEVLSLPQSKGLDNLIYYIVGAKPLVKKFSE